MKESVIGTRIITQIGFLVRDAEATAKAYAEFFGVEYSTGATPAPEIAKMQYLGQPSNGSCKQGFVDLGDVQMEFIQPDDQPSLWRDDLEKNGEGLHHIAFWVKDMEGHIQKLKELDYPMLQRGGWPGGRYAYFDAQDKLKLRLELLEKVDE